MAHYEPITKNLFIPSWDVWRKNTDEIVGQHEIELNHPMYAHQVTLGSSVDGTTVAFTCFTSNVNPLTLKNVDTVVENLSANNLPALCQGMFYVTDTWYIVNGVLRTENMTKNQYYITYINPSSGLQNGAFTANTILDRVTVLKAGW